MVACAGLLQDLGFNLTESETELGLVTGEKDRTAVEGGQVAGWHEERALGNPTEEDRGVVRGSSAEGVPGAGALAGAHGCAAP